MFYKLIIIFLCLNNRFLLAKPSENSNENIVLITIPKSGTHLLMKCINSISDNKFFNDYNDAKNVNNSFKLSPYPPNDIKGMYYIQKVGTLQKDISENLIAKSNGLYWTHWPYTLEFSNLLYKTTKANFLMIRDPRDVIVSFAHMIYKFPDWKDIKRLPDFNLDEIIMDLITGNKKHYVPWAVSIQQTYPLFWESGISNFYNMYIPYLRNRKILLIKFENLIGPKGGGSLIAQKRELKKIARVLGYNLTNEKLNKVIDDAFGNTWTFREGQIGSWKKYFTLDHINAFKNTPNANQILINFGYEVDENW